MNPYTLTAPPLHFVVGDTQPQLAPLLPMTSPPKWTWSCRRLDADQYSPPRLTDQGDPQPGDVAVVRVEALGYHTKIMTASNEQLRLYPGDLLVGVFGNRYATDAYEAEVHTLEDLSILTNAGMIGTVFSRHANMKKPTQITFLHYLSDRQGRRLNLKRLQFHPRLPQRPAGKIILVAGSGMNSGKTTTMMKLTKALLNQGQRVAACKLTGSVSTNDRGELCATGAQFVTDFSDYGFPSTYLCREGELVDLFHTMMADAATAQPDVTVVEIADGLLQRETRLLLAAPLIQQQVSGVVLAATCASSAIYGLEQLQMLGHRVVVDVHTYPPRRQHLLQHNLVYCHDVFLDIPTNPAISHPLYATAGERLLRPLLDQLIRRYYQSARYTLVRPSGKVRHSTPDLVDARNGLALRYGAFTVLLEGRQTGVNNPARPHVYSAQVTALQQIVAWAQQNSDALCIAAPLPQPDTTIPIRTRSVYADSHRTMLFVDAHSQATRLFTLPGPYMAHVAPAHPTPLPLAYAVPRTQVALLTILARQGFQHQTPGSEQLYGVQQYHVEHLGKGAPCLRVETCPRPLPDFLLFPVAQEGGQLLALFLEPAARYGLVRAPQAELALQAGAPYPILRVIA